MNLCRLCRRVRLGPACGRCDRGPSVRVTVPLNMASTGACSSPEYLAYLQRVVQEAVLRYNVNNGGEP